jgi:hypothetical protein
MDEKRKRLEELGRLAFDEERDQVRKARVFPSFGVAPSMSPLPLATRAALSRPGADQPFLIR